MKSHFFKGLAQRGGASRANFQQKIMCAIEKVVMRSRFPSNKTMDTSYQPDQSKGALVSAIIIIILLVAGGIYVISERAKDLQNSQNATSTEITIYESEVVESTSTDIDAIETDLDNTNLDSLDQEIKSLDAEFAI